MKEANKTKRKLNIYIFLMLLLILLIVAYIMYTKPLEVREMAVVYSVGDKLGFDLNSSVISFGKVPQRGMAQRTISIYSDYDFPIEGKVYLSKDISKLMVADPFFEISPKQSTNITFSLYIPDKTQFGNYSGSVKLVFYRK